MGFRMEFQGFGPTIVNHAENSHEQKEDASVLNESVLRQIGKGVWETFKDEVESQSNFPIENIVRFFDSEEISNDTKEALIDMLMKVKTLDYNRNDAEALAAREAVRKHNREIVASIGTFVDGIDF